jgi:hypothetical protein
MLPILAAMNVAQQRERQRILDEMVRARGMMPLLMKPRNGGHWTPVERARLMAELHALAGLSPYLVPLVMPGGFMLLPILAWWLDRRRIIHDAAVLSLTEQHRRGYNDNPAPHDRVQRDAPEIINPSQGVTNMEKIRIGLIGAGETGTPLLKQLLDASFVEIVGVADLNSDMPGMKLARERGIKTTGDFMEIARLGNGVDIVIEATGVAKVRDQLRQHMQETGNHHTIIMHELIAVLLMSLSQGKLVSMKHGQVDYGASK